MANVPVFGEIDIKGKTEKTTPVAADLILIEDSEAGYLPKKILFSACGGGGGGTGDVVGPASALDNALARWDLATGKLLQNSGVILDDSNNMTIPATKTSIHTFTNANWNEDAATWTMGASGPLVHVTGNATTVTATNSEAIVIGTTYKITITGTGGGGTATYTFGGVTGSIIPASGAIAITGYITAITTDSMVITPASACTASITSITIEKLTDATGDSTVEGDLIVGSQAIFNSQIILKHAQNGSALYPRIVLDNENNVGLFIVDQYGSVGMAFNNVLYQKFSTNYHAIYSDSAQFLLGSGLDTSITRPAPATIATQNIWPSIDDTYYLGKLDDDTPFAWKGVVLKDTANGKYYVIRVTNGAIVAVDLTD